MRALAMDKTVPGPCDRHLSQYGADVIAHESNQKALEGEQRKQMPVHAHPRPARSHGVLTHQVMEQLSEGGGAQTITIDTVGEEVEELAKNYPICIPAYFGLIIRCFGTLEGLGLSIDPGYSIVKECFPYLCRRLLTEDTPRMRRMLKSFLYGKDGDFLQVVVVLVVVVLLATLMVLCL